MSVRIGLISDVHASPEPLRQALERLQAEAVQTILCAGDIAGYGPDLVTTVALLKAHDCCCILGNHDLWRLDDPERVGPAETYLRGLPQALALTIADRTLYMVHASPPDSLMNGIKLLDEDGAVLAEEKVYWSEALDGGPADVLVVGHTHQVFAEWLGSTLVVNPGSTLFNHTCAVLTLPERTVQFLPLGGHTPLMSWNWGMIGGGLNGR